MHHRGRPLSGRGGVWTSCTSWTSWTSCYSNISTQDFACLNSCSGWYADVEYSKDTDLISDPQVAAIIEEYQGYKYKYARNVVFDGAQKSYGRLVKKLI